MCWYCGMPVTEAEPLGRSLVCSGCGRDMRCCKNCRFYLPAARGNCSESQAEKPSDMERANFCDWFSLNAALRKKHDGAQNNAGAAAKAKSAFSDLFN